MEPNALGGGIFSNISSGLVGVENPLQQQQQPNLQNQQNPHPLHHPQMVSYATHHDTDAHQQSIKHGYNYSATKTNKPQSTLSDEDEPVFTADDNSSGDPKRKVSPWHRMKWTDTMVRLLIMAVYYIGDEAGSEGTDPAGKKKATGLLQKKGKWKSVSKGMMEKGYYVSPQQCEDKFNDLNKRYKRVNDILGKGTACRVVENQSLLDTMDLSPKMKEEVRKLLNSKHLFFREMCAYHNSCGHGSNNNNNGASNVQQSAEAGTESQPQHHHHPQQQLHQQQRCFHSSENGVGSLRMLRENDDEEEDDDSEDYSDEEEEESAEGGSRGTQVEDDENDGMRKRPKKGGFGVSSSQVMQQLSSEANGVLQDGGKSRWEKKQWMKKRVVQLEEQQVDYQVQAFELEKQRLKWTRFSSKKEREMERDKLENERKRLEIERMVLLLRHKELELLNIQQQKQQHQQQHSST
ncbi:uncharacterized protein LOC113863792 [Abrus precatorius]|uniref:Uncharacterized protein LOC113863792 n=1 Tax=Abrus precatorius TaxID=3816 RepID=A0A8B8LDD1_ABRPR|nr:uncharacterized protein LOC113863792 [Abrus precatorius]